MEHLSIETSTRSGSVALFRDGLLVGEQAVPDRQRTSAALVPLIAECLASCGVQADRLGLVSVAVGPGSFTGLRIGITVAKTLAWAAGCPVAPVSSHQVVLHQTIGSLRTPGIESPRKIASLVDAQRAEWFVACFSNNHGDWVDDRANDSPSRIVGADQLAELLPAETLLGGPGLASRAGQRLVSSGMFPVAPPACWNPTAQVVGKLGQQMLDNEEVTDCWKIAPVYGRPSAAEEKLADRKSGDKK